ncbi:MAG: hypothetical protein FHP92_09015 [Denitromonas halophila]|nr:MAG: hypothetical protein FHP92_09015 [Denitromonas halophila]
MKDEADRHKKEVDELEKAAAALKVAGEEIESERTEKSLRELEKARDERKSKLEELRTEQAKLLRENESGADMVNRRQDRVRRIGAELRVSQSRLSGEAAALLGKQADSLKAEWDELNATAVMFSSAKLKLQSLKIE